MSISLLTDKPAQSFKKNDRNQLSTGSQRNRVGLVVSCFFLLRKVSNLATYVEASQIKSKKHPKKVIKKAIERIVPIWCPINSMAL